MYNEDKYEKEDTSEQVSLYLSLHRSWFCFVLLCVNFSGYGGVGKRACQLIFDGTMTPKAGTKETLDVAGAPGKK